MKAFVKGLKGLIFCAIMMLSFSVRAAASEIGEQGDNIASGVDGDITWTIDASGKLTVEGSGDLTDNNNIPWEPYGDQITSTVINVSGMTDASRLFVGCYNMQSVDLSDFDTSQVTGMSYMFGGCRSLMSLDLSGFDTSQVTDMGWMFGDCSSLMGLDVSSFVNSQVTNMNGMFSGCRSLTSLNLSDFDTSRVTDMNSMFWDCSSLTSLDLSDFDTSQVTDMGYMFNYCRSLTSLDLSGFDTSRVTRMDDMFISCDALVTIKTPLNVSVQAALPYGTWRVPDGTVVTELPQGLSYSVTLTRDGQPEITTTTEDLNMQDVIRVKYVPYYYTIETSNQDTENKVTFTIEEGRLAEGLSMDPATGVIYGVPLEAGEFPLTIMATYSNTAYQPSYAKITLTVLENTEEYIEGATDAGYEITKPVSDFSLDSVSQEGTQELISEGQYIRFRNVYLDGIKLTEGEGKDYTYREGSTIITLRSQTLGNAGVGTHTLSIEFDEEGVLKRAAQNYTVKSNTTGSETTKEPEPTAKPESTGEPQNKPGATPAPNQGDNGSAGTGSSNSGSGSSGSGSSNSGTSSGSTESSGQALLQSQTEVIFYKVRPGDTLWKIAVKFYKWGGAWRRIYEDNAAVIRNPRVIYAGQMLQIRYPVAEEASAQASGTDATQYRVQGGDTLWGIAVRIYGNGQYWRVIYDANRSVIKNPDRIHTGQILTIAVD